MHVHRVLLAVVCTAALGTVACDPGAVLRSLLEDTPEETARKRVAYVMGALTGGTNVPYASVVSTFYRGVSPSKLSEGENYQATIEFDRFKRQGGLEGLRSYEILEATEVDDDPPTFVLSLRLDGKRRKVRVPADGALAWTR